MVCRALGRTPYCSGSCQHCRSDPRVPKPAQYTHHLPIATHAVTHTASKQWSQGHYALPLTRVTTTATSPREVSQLEVSPTTAITKTAQLLNTATWHHPWPQESIQVVPQVHPHNGAKPSWRLFPHHTLQTPATTATTHSSLHTRYHQTLHSTVVVVMPW